MVISIIIPTLNEAEGIGDLIRYLQADPSFPLVKEVLVVDGGSRDGTPGLAESEGARIVHSSQKSRAIQMNLGAAQACGEWLYFLHADTYPPVGYAQRIWEQHPGDTVAGCFRLRFDWGHWFLRANSWFTRFNTPWFRFGDQSLFVRKAVFQQVCGFNESMGLFEDQDLARRLGKMGKFRVLTPPVVTSARKYRQNGPFRLQLAYFIIYMLYSLGFSQRTLDRSYHKLVAYPRV